MKVTINKILVIDYGSQYTQLIARRIRELQTYCEVIPFNKVNKKNLNDKSLCGIILSGGPNSVKDKKSPKLNGKIIDQIYITDLTHQSLLIFKGNSSNLKANSLINILKNNDFEKKYQIESLEFINKRRWDIILYNDVKLLLSEEDPNKSIQNFIMLQNKLSETDINNIKTYDLRNLKKTILINLND